MHTCTHSNTHITHTHTQAAEKRHYAVAELLVSASSDAVPVRDKREKLAWDLVKPEDTRLRELLKLS